MLSNSELGKGLETRCGALREFPAMHAPLQADTVGGRLCGWARPRVRPVHLNQAPFPPSTKMDHLPSRYRLRSMLLKRDIPFARSKLSFGDRECYSTHISPLSPRRPNCLEGFSALGPSLFAHDTHRLGIFSSQNFVVGAVGVSRRQG